MRSRLWRALPPVADGMRIGLLGGSFNPPHDAHRAISRYAIARLGLDQVWWLVTPGNPLKAAAASQLTQRAAAAQAMADDPRIVVTCLEAAIGTRYTVDTLAWLRRRCHDVRFVWIMGGDNLAQFDRWRRWRDVAMLMPLAVIDRPPAGLGALASPAARALSASRIPEAAAATLAGMPTPRWVFLTGMKSPMSSTALRKADGSWL